MPEPPSGKKRMIEAILDNEALTDGLEDEEAQAVLQWAINRIEALTPGTDQRLDACGQTIMRQARTIARMANHIRDGDAPDDRLRRYLQRLTDDEVQQDAFLRQLEHKRPLPHYIRSLCHLAEGQ